MLITLIAQYGIPFVAALLKEIETGKGTITSDTLLSLHAKYGSLSAADYLAQAGGAPAPTPIPPATPPVVPTTPPVTTTGL
jgi:hypothetical protein